MKNFFVRKSIYFLLLPLIVWSCKPQKTPSAEKKSESRKVKKEKQLRSSADSLDFKIGQMIMIGILDRTSLKPDDSFLEDIRQERIGGIILFEKNIQKTNSKEALKKLIADMQACAKIPLLVTVDEEGGKVHRLKEKYGFVKMPSAAYLGKTDNRDTTYFYADNLAKLLAELGFNLNYAPSVDLALNKENPIIAKVERSFSDDPAKVTEHALTFIDAHHANNVKTILKHFPGHGSSASDTHLGIADVTDSWKIIELMPYHDLIKDGACDAIMTAHIVNCHLDTACLPSTLSKTVITDVLRGLLGFDGVVFSDDMQMNAISKNYGLENAVKLAINAGVDIVLFGNNVNASDRLPPSELHGIIKKLVLNKEIPIERINESYDRIMKLKKSME
jgi:beta-N-acetylhexosaminidase